MGKGAILNNLGMLADSLGQEGEARGYFEQARVIFQEIGDMVHVRLVTENMAYLDREILASLPDSNSDDLPDAAPPALPAEKTPQRKRRWLRRRRPTT
ncbi:MAG TPA: hypothetical protein VGF38_20650 [Ktedonobacterales bacterium]